MNIFSRLSEKSNLTISKFVENGWEFRDATWECYHRGTPYRDVEFKSPNMSRFATIDEKDWKNIDENYLLDREAYHVAYEWVDEIFPHIRDISSPLISSIKEHILETKNPNMKRLSKTDIEFDTKIKSINPKKVKLTIEIL